MNEQGAYGSRLGEAFRMRNPPVLKTRSLRKAQLAVTALRCDSPGFGMTTPIPREDAFLVGLQTRDCANHELWIDGKPVAVRPIVAGETMLYDLKHDPIAYLGSPFQPLFFYLPRAALDAVADDCGAPRIEDLHYQPGMPIDDPTIKALGALLRPALDQPERVNAVFADHVMLALCAHVAQTYGRMLPRARTTRGSLAPWQERRAKEILSANLDGNVSLAALARECGLSLSYFTRAFRQSTGVPPHRWLLRHRVKKANDLLQNSTMSLTDIAMACGFADQSHFTRVFTAASGRSPGATRRMQRT